MIHTLLVLKWLACVSKKRCELFGHKWSDKNYKLGSIQTSSFAKQHTEQAIREISESFRGLKIRN